METLLLISDRDDFVQEIKDILSDLNLFTKKAINSTFALKLLKEERFDFILLDSRIGDLPCESLLKKINLKSPYSELFVAIDSEKDSKNFLGCGADETLRLPLKKEEVHLKINKATKQRSFLKSCGLVGKSTELKRIAEAIMQAAPTVITVLLTGESGTGKELIARAIHKNSLRETKPFVAANCGALAEGVLESELFGHEKGAFTGAISRRAGLFERADKGTIFLDEITEIPLQTQVKLLRVLEERSFLRVGGTEDINVDVRVISATNRDIDSMVRDGSFRADLYYRICVVKIDVPPLRERTKDIPLLVYDFIQKLNQQSERKITGVSDEAMELLLRYHWPGNVRELKNFLESMLVLAPNRIIEGKDVRGYVEKQFESQRTLPVITGKSVQTAEHELIYQALLGLRKEITELRRAIIGVKELKPEDRVDVSSEWGREVKPGEVEQNLSMEDVEKELIEKTLRNVGGNRKKAAKILGIGERTLYRKIDRYGLKDVR